MPRISLTGFKDPVRRPRYIIWTGVAVLMLAAVMIVALGVTSTRWFCAEGCHKVQDDTITAYARSSHSQISCMACHMPVSANPVIFIIHKAEALGELYLTVTNNFELPLNAESHVALTMSSQQCLQCHNLKTRVVTASDGVKIDHAAHAEINAACPVCHNRVGHREDFDLALKDPKTGEPNKKHEDFMSMEACFRCHSLEKDAAAPGRCSACHPADFKLVPESHEKKDFYPKGHADMAKEMKAESDAAAAGGSGEEGGEAEGAAEEGVSFLGPEEAYASSGGEGKAPVSKDKVGEIIEAQREVGANEHDSIGAELPTVESVFYCSTCHAQSFCSNCHGMEMPHPAAFKEPKKADDPAGHPAVSKAQAAKCIMCHGKNEQTHFCDNCHHGSAVKWQYDAKAPWRNQHASAVKTTGVKACTGKCHQAQFCVECHTKTKAVPTSHRQKGWTKPQVPTVTIYGTAPAKPSALHALDAQKSMEACEVCHGSGGTEAAFCKGCHKMAMPHPDEFKKLHVSSKNNKAACANCHTFRELCSNCHHVGASFTQPWLKVHGGAVNAKGASGCLEKCHKQDDCVKCHTARKVVPGSHRAKNFVRDFGGKAAHTQLYTKDATICTYCHAGAAGDLAKSKFCAGCHKLDMPHALNSGDKQKFAHKDMFKNKQVSKGTCLNCHQQAFCDTCHHEGSVAGKPWLRYHPNIVRGKGAQPCFECHDPTFCANCHVSLAKRGLL